MMPKDMVVRRCPSSSIRVCSGDLRSSALSSMAHTWPSSVDMAVATTTPEPRPARTSVPMNAQFVRSATGSGAAAGSGEPTVVMVTTASRDPPLPSP